MTGRPVAAEMSSAPVLRIGTKADLIESVGERFRDSLEFDVIVSTTTGLGWTS